jgi:hypothetical protein
MGRTGGLERVRDWLAGGVTRRMSRTVDRLAAAFAETRPDRTATDKAVREYGRALRLALRVDTKQAEALFRTYDARIPPERYPLTAADEPWLAESADVLAVGGDNQFGGKDLDAAITQALMPGSSGKGSRCRRRARCAGGWRSPPKASKSTCPPRSTRPTGW